MAPRAGLLVDRGGFARGALVGGALVILGWSMAAFGTRSVVWLAGGALIIDLGTGLAHGANLIAWRTSLSAEMTESVG